MTFAIMGAGAMGAYIGGRLAAAGHDVALIARGAHLEALRSEGLRIQSPKGDLHLPDIRATDKPADIGPVDVIIFMVKNYDVETAAHAIAPMLGPDTMVVTFQNGVSAPERLGAIIGAARVLPGVARFPADIMAPGVVRHSAPFDRLIFGESDMTRTQRCAHLFDDLNGAGLMATVSPDIGYELWSKLVLQASFSALCALTRLNIGPLLDNAASADLLRRSMLETADVARAVRPDLPDDLHETQWQFLKGLPGNVHASMLDDLQRGNRIEVNYLSGDVVRLGEENGVPTPLHATFVAALQPFLDGAPDQNTA